ncbi:MAG TPA: hypothetical protein VKY40_06995 [Halanaerobiales bacterium]|nr:hypothetical protein [Halanaerobiales bacterium]
MKNFREKMKRRIVFQVLTIIIVAAVYFILLYNKDKIAGENYIVSFVRGFQTGLFVSLQAVSIYYLFKYISALKNEETLKEIYIKENDERKIMIEQKAGSVSMIISYIILALASIIAGFYNQIIFFTLVGTLLFLAFTRLFMYLYFNRRY